MESKAEERRVQLTEDERKALRRMQIDGDDRQLKAKKWRPILVTLFKLGFIRRRVGDWAWVPTN
jgi:hypothetical protein